MSFQKTLLERSGSKCELCSSTSSLSAYLVPPKKEERPEYGVCLCEKCLGFIQNPKTQDLTHWRALSESMWSEVPAVQVLSWRILKGIQTESWALDLFSQLYLDEENQKWAEDMEPTAVSSDETKPTKDSNGTILLDGDTVTLIKDLDVKGAGFTAKRGTIVKKISLTSNPLHIEGRVNGVQIVLVAAYLKKVIA